MKLVRTAILTTLTALLLSLSLSTPSWAQWGFPPQQPAASEQDVQELQHQDRLNEERINSLKTLVESQNSRISDLQTFGGWVIGALGLLFPIAMIIVSRATYVSAKAEAGETANKWMDDHAPEKVEELEAHYREQIETRLADSEQKIKSLLEDAKDSVRILDQIVKSAQETIPKGEGTKISDTDRIVVRVAAQKINEKPESERTYSDWKLLATEAYLEGDFQASIRAHDHAVNAGDATQEQVASALFNKAWGLGKDEQVDDALTAYDELEARFGKSNELALREWAAKALVNKGGLFNQQGRAEEEISAYDAVVERFGNSKDPKIQEPVARALVNKALALSRDGCTEDELAAYNVVVERFGDSEDPKVRNQLSKAFGNRGYLRLTLAKEAGQKTGSADEVKALLLGTLSDVEAGLEDMPDDPMHLGNQAYTLFLLGRDDESEEPLRRALELGGEELYLGTLDDAKIHPLPQDEAFVALVERLWAEVQAAEKDA